VSCDCGLLQKRRQSLLNMQQTLSAVLFPAYRRRVLGLLMLHPDEVLHGREIARRTGLPSGTLTRELLRLAGVGLLKRARRGNQYLYSADRACPVFEEVAGILRKTSGIADVLAEALAPARPRIVAAFVFGSVAQGREQAGSDIDLILIGDAGFGETVKLLHPAQRMLGREINPKVYGLREWMAKRTAPDAFLRDVLAKPKIFVIGAERELGQSRRHKPRVRRA
jgi:predicted nucleotidyltransferase